MTTPRAKGLLARFAVENGRFSASAVKPKLFEPNKKLKLSVFDISGLVCTEICDLGIDVARQHRTARQLYGWGEISEAILVSENLQIEYDNRPPRHANIVGWPEEPSERKLKQQLLARQANPVRLDQPVQV